MNLSHLRRLGTSVLVLLGLSLASLSAAEHPRLIASADDWTRALEQARTDPALKALIDQVFAQADFLLAVPPVEHKLTGKRLLAVSRESLGRILQLSAAYRWSGRAEYARRAEAELRAIAMFPDWNPSHFIDVGEMTAAAAFGYDWLFDQLSPDTRNLLRDAIANHGLRPALDPNAPHNAWQQYESNWPQVCWGGLTLGALAMAEDNPELSGTILERARANIWRGLKGYAPDGLYPEGPGYWSYGTTFQVIMIDALRSALGSDWDLPASPGFLDSAAVLAHLTGPSGLAYNFSDSGDESTFAPCLLWFARETHNPALLAPFHEALSDYALGRDKSSLKRFTVLAALWWPTRETATTQELPLAWHSAGTQPVAVLRSSWQGANASYLAAKGGSASLNHAHMDAGSFVFDADGVRWALDLGRQNYESIESQGIRLWDRKQDGDRWRIFRLNNFSHNTLVIDGQLQRVDGHATLLRFTPGKEPSAVFDLSSVYAGQASKVIRSFQLDRHRRVLVQDQLSGLRPGAEVRWAMLTAADVTINGPEATLRDGDRTLHVSARAPVDATFEVISADPSADGFNAPNPGRRILILKLPATADGSLSLAVQLTPGSTTPGLPVASLLRLP